MDMNDIALPAVLSVPAYWTESRIALLHTADGRLIGKIRRVVRYTRRFLGIPLSHIEILAISLDDNPTPSCTILLRAGFPMQYTGGDGKPCGFLKQKPFSVFPEFDCTDEFGKLIGTIKTTGMHTANFTFNDINCCVQFSKTKGKSPRQYVWELNANSTNQIDIRLVLGFIALGQMPYTVG